MDDNSRPPSRLLDRIAVALSGVCLIHCLALPLAIALLPVLGQFAAGHFHVQMLAVALPVSVVALALGIRRHRNGAVAAWGAIGMLLLVLGGTVAHAAYGLAVDRALTMSGAFILAIAHYFNSRLSRHGCGVAFSSRIP